MGVLLTTKLVKGAVGAAEMAAAAGKAVRAGKRAKRRVNEVLHPCTARAHRVQKEETVTMKKSTLVALVAFLSAVAGALAAMFVYLRRREKELDEYEQLLFSEEFSHEEPEEAPAEDEAAEEADEPADEEE